MAAVREDEVGFDEGMLWCLPSHVLEEACHTEVHTRHRHQNYQQLRHHKSPQSQHSKSSLRSHQRPKLGSGGPGMQAIFLESGQRTGGTGVFLPRTTGKNFQPSSKKPGCAPVLLPNRVIQALNLNVHALGLQISPRQDPRHKPRCGDDYKNSSKRKNEEKDVSKQHNQSLYPAAGIFLPKEWSY